MGKCYILILICNVNVLSELGFSFLVVIGKGLWASWVGVQEARESSSGMSLQTRR